MSGSGIILQGVGGDQAYLGISNKLYFENSDISIRFGEGSSLVLEVSRDTR
jgi:hypothetical protein